MTDISITQGGQHASAHREAKPNKWALTLWARAFRRLARRWTVHSHVRKYCRPFTVEGAENLASIENPVLIIANHTSHFDTKRSRTGELLPFHGGPAILATLQNVPVLPIYIEGASRILPPGTNRSQPAPVVARVGSLLTFPEGTPIDDAKHALEEAVRALAGTLAADHEQAAAS